MHESSEYIKATSFKTLVAVLFVSSLFISFALSNGYSIRASGVVASCSIIVLCSAIVIKGRHLLPHLFMILATFPDMIPSSGLANSSVSPNSPSPFAADFFGVSPTTFMFIYLGILIARTKTVSFPKIIVVLLFYSNASYIY
jgi:hypothetical protein